MLTPVPILSATLYNALLYLEAGGEVCLIVPGLEDGEICHPADQGSTLLYLLPAAKICPQPAWRGRVLVRPKAHIEGRARQNPPVQSHLPENQPTVLSSTINQ